MSVEVLQSRRQYEDARRLLKGKGLDCVSSLAFRLVRKLGLTRRPAIGDRKKSWDVLKTVDFLQERIPRDGAILDIGAYGSEMLCILHRLGFSRLSGIDLNPNMQEMPYAGSVEYVTGDLMETPFKDGSFEAVTAISVIEHGFDPDRLLAELSRLLRPGGYFIASVDYWPEKIDTSGVNAYGMDWNIFSADELRSFMAKARSFGFVPLGATEYLASERPIGWLGKQFTFAWLVLRKEGPARAS